MVFDLGLEAIRTSRFAVRLGAVWLSDHPSDQTVAMCGRYRLSRFDLKELGQLFTGQFDKFEEFSQTRIVPRFNIGPTQIVPIVKASKEGNQIIAAGHDGRNNDQIKRPPAKCPFVFWRLIFKRFHAFDATKSTVVKFAQNPGMLAAIDSSLSVESLGGACVGCGGC